MQDENREQIRERLLNDETTRANISLRAYEIYEQRGCAPGCELGDWLQAENEMLPLLVEDELQGGAESQAASDEVKTEKLTPLKTSQRRRPLASSGVTDQ